MAAVTTPRPVRMGRLVRQSFTAMTRAERDRVLAMYGAIGGLHVTARPDEALEHADYVFTGEGEQAWPEAR